MKKFFTCLSFMLLSASLFAATEQAWYNDVTSITNNGQYYIYSVNGKGFMQGGNSKVKAVTQNNYNSESNLLFTISTSNKRTYSGSNYLCSYETRTCGPVGGTNTGGSTMIWEGKSGYWLVYGSYFFIWTQKAYLRYEDNAYAATCLNPSLSDSKFHWYLVSPAQYDRHWAIYLYDRYKESISDYTKWENLVPAAYYTALSDAYAVTYNVQNAEHSKEVVNAHRADLKALYDNAEAVANAYAAAKDKINALEAVEDKGEDFADVTAGITAARSAIEEAMSVDALNAAVSAPALKAIDPITFSVTEFTAINPVEGAAASVAGRAITYEAVDKSIINNGKAIYKGITKLTATAAATDAYYKFVRSAQVTVSAPTTYGAYEAQFCQGSSVEFEGVEYKAPTTEPLQIKLAQKNYLGGDSIVALTVVELPIYEIAEEKTVYQNEAYEWQGQVRPTDVIGEFNFTAPYTTVEGCDSIYTLALKVIERPTTYGEYEEVVCEGGSVEYAGKTYTQSVQEDVLLEMKNVYGGDSIVHVAITVNPLSYTAAEMEITVGDEVEWNGIALKDSTIGVHTVVYTTTNAVGCDSIVTLTLTVNKLAPVEVNYPIGFCTGDSAEYRGKWYYENALDTIYAEGDVRDTIIYVEAMLLPTTDLVVLYDTIVSGNEVILPEGEWVIGEDTVSGTYPTVESEDASELIFHQYLDEPVVCGPNYIELIVTVTPKEQKPGDTTTDIEDVLDAQKAEKVLIDGVLYIRRNDALYTTEGRRVE